MKIKWDNVYAQGVLKLALSSCSSLKNENRKSLTIHARKCTGNGLEIQLADSNSKNKPWPESKD